MAYVLIALHAGGEQFKEIVGFRIMNVDTMQVLDVEYNKFVSTINSMGIDVNGVSISPEGIPSGSNGSFCRYTHLIDGIPVDKCPIVIIKEYPDKVYEVCNHLGKVVKMNMESLIDFAEKEGIANGKIVNSDNGKYISSINGEYIKDKSFKDLEYGDKLRLKMNMLGVKAFKLDENYLAVGINKEADELLIGKGCLGIAANGFRDFINLKKIVLPSTCLELGIGAFYNCKNLEEIVIPEGVKTISRSCFEKCVSLKKIVLPNSVRNIERNAFKASGLIEVSLGPVRPTISNGAFTPNTKIKVRR